MDKSALKEKSVDTEKDGGEVAVEHIVPVIVESPKKVEPEPIDPIIEFDA